MKFNKLLKSGLGAEESGDQSEGSASLYLRFGQLKKQLKVMAHAMSQDSEGARCAWPPDLPVDAS